MACTRAKDTTYCTNGSRCPAKPGKFGWRLGAHAWVIETMQACEGPPGMLRCVRAENMRQPGGDSHVFWPRPGEPTYFSMLSCMHGICRWRIFQWQHTFALHLPVRDAHSAVRQQPRVVLQQGLRGGQLRACQQDAAQQPGVQALKVWRWPEGCCAALWRFWKVYSNRAAAA